MSLIKSDSNIDTARILNEPVHIHRGGTGVSLNGLNDDQLITRAAAQDAAALEVLYDRYASAVMGFAFKLLDDHALAEEVVQETFWRVWRNAGTFSLQRGPFPGWLFGIG